MTVTAELRSDIEQLLYREGRFLDRHEWEAWLDLYTPDVTYWVPAWKSEHEPTSCPQSELSLIYYSGRNGLEDRVVRATSGQSPASNPLARTVHTASNVVVDEAGPDELLVSSAWTTHVYQPLDRDAFALFGHAEYRLRRHEGAWKIAAKKTVIVNEALPAVIDFYHL